MEEFLNTVFRALCTSLLIYGMVYVKVTSFPPQTVNFTFVVVVYLCVCFCVCLLFIYLLYILNCWNDISSKISWFFYSKNSWNTWLKLFNFLCISLHLGEKLETKYWKLIFKKKIKECPQLSGGRGCKNIDGQSLIRIGWRWWGKTRNNLCKKKSMSHKPHPKVQSYKLYNV